MKSLILLTVPLVTSALVEIDIKISERQNLLSLAALSAPSLLDKALEDYFDVQIFSTVYVGSQKQPLNLIFDTGSAVS